MHIDAVRSLSHKLFGANHRLEAAAAIASLQGKPISSRTVADQARLDYNRAHEQVAWFASAGLLVPDFDPKSRTKDYRAVDSVFWQLCRRLLHELDEREDLS
jgi:hypothetical protein